MHIFDTDLPAGLMPEVGSVAAMSTFSNLLSQLHKTS
jgi:hypothetical protein